MPDDLQQLAEQTARTAKGRVTKIRWQDKTLWVKRAVPNKAKIWHKMQKAAAMLVPLPILRPTPSHGGSEGLQHEADRIAEFTKAGFAVPKIYGLTDNWILLEHLGTLAEGKLKKNPDAADDDIPACAAALARLHNAGLAHGRAKLNDIVLRPNGDIGFIDFEEDIYSADIPLPALQARDIWLFCCSVARYAKYDPAIIDKAMTAYQSINHDTLIMAELKRLLAVLRPFQKLLRPVAARLPGDVRRAYMATTSLITLFL